MRALCLVAMVLLAASLPQVSGAAEMKFNAELRLQGEAISSDTFGIASREDDAVMQERLLMQSDLANDFARLFVQLGVSNTDGRNGGPSPVDESDPDTQQAFVELSLPRIGRLRAGRQEWSFGSGRLVSVRDGPNLRRSFDAVQLDRDLAGGSWKVLFGRPVENRPGSFDDRTNDTQSLAGLYSTWPRIAEHWTLDLYWLRLHRDVARFASAVGRERRDSWGFRWSGESGAWSVNTEALLQTGTFANQDIRAWTLATDTRYRIGSVEWGFKANIASGDGNPNDGRLETFNALYPNPSYFSEAALISPSNFIDAQPFVSLSITPDLTLSGGWDLLWKHRQADAIYTTPVPMTAVPNSTGTSRFVGQQAQIVAAWQLSSHLLLEGSYVRFIAGRGLREAGGDDVDFAQLKLTASY